MVVTARAEGKWVQQGFIVPKPPPLVLSAKVTPLCGRAMLAVTPGTVFLVLFLPLSMPFLDVEERRS